MIKILRSPIKSFFSWIFREELNDLHYSITEHRILKKQYEKEISNVTSNENPVSILFKNWADGFFKDHLLNVELSLSVIIEEMRDTNPFLKYCSVKTFNENLKSYCLKKGFILNPYHKAQPDGRILKTISGKVTEMIYIET
ncbi:hypothetical protein [Chryseobacterium luquanense]|uniref:Uncharacterized protein n=1 Tax=Chryseobacterium luquanense TaxID=2983766 RepID=A0ABT3Y4L2_9FLAO|nr:hypothetical protein [Chryseobacterium luquanense]MCX8533075.1 hypothetical protein [Chryseobacterium luquanense]